MLTCIACSKHIDDSPEDDTRGATPSTKDAAKSLTAQIKDMALKFSGAYRQCKPCTGSSSSGYKKGGHHHHHHHHYPDFDTASESGQYPYLRAASSSSTPAWDFTNPNFNTNMMGSMNRDGSRPKGIMGGDQTPSSLSYDAVLVEEEEPKEWMAQVEPGVLITFVSLPNGGNDLKRIRFSREMFNKLQAQRWWGENYDRIMELYNVQRFNRQALHTPPRSEDERDPLSRMGSARESPVTLPYHKERTPKSSYRSAGKGYGPSDFPETSHNYNAVPNFSSYGGGSGGVTKTECSSVDASRTTTSSRDEASISISNASEQECEWVEQDEPGVFITIRALPDGTRELRRVRFSRERFGEVHAKLWWEENRERIQAQYL